MAWRRTRLEWIGRLAGVLMGSLALACGSDGPGTGATDGETEASTGTSTGSEPDPTTEGLPPGDGTTPDSSSGEPEPADTSSSGPDPDTDGCPAGTEGCPCDAGRTCDRGLACDDQGICQAAPACRPLDPEPHDDEASADMLTGLDCGNDLVLGPYGTLEAPQTDWYQYFGDEGVVFCTEQPSATIVADITTEVCVYIECLEGNTESVTCSGSSSSATSPEGRPGCCGEDQAQIDDYGCSGFLTPKNVDIWISVGSAEVACADYELSYGF